MDLQLRQRGRAAVDFMGYLSLAARPLWSAIDADIAAAGHAPANLPDDLDDRAGVIEAALADSRAFRTHELVSEWHARQHGHDATEAFEEVARDGLLPQLPQGSAELTISPDFRAPEYWDGVDFHRTAGGWDGHEMAGYIHGEIIHRRMVDRVFPGGIFRQRRAIAERPPRDHYDRIIDFGASTGHFTLALQDAYPQAEIWGVDLSARALEHARRVADAHGHGWKLFQRAAEDTGFAAGSFDLAASYILLHEMPERAIRALFAEAFRLLRPGGDMIMSDVTRFADIDRLSAWKADHGARFGGEPYWRESASLDLAQVARDAGFEDVEASGLYPHVVQGRKPQ
ncbi:class I SAM-dependent methyltransferase [Novosphingobium sp. SL115]|uniref:class I SAM-dependent methyltransferase n=1 Tax=Novosphingobium sp. SL115 TaxID=2995150 RepID=UPI002275BEAA|nr:class I SAM-dependent methyltransferase [Novosphingobium sp. SL115]MCY1673082.1 class I SAM-dependent methyltransferase [Novosphingobium sp. SL115]